MANFMGPMAPPPAAPGQPPQLDIRTNPNQRQRFRNFMRQNTRPAGMTGAPPMYPAAQTPFPAAPMPPMAMPAPTPLMPMQVSRPMQQPMAQPMGPARNVDIFSPQYMQAQPPVGMEDGGSVPPRRTVIKGQPHMLSYINAEEAGILKALGGSGEPGPMGIPSYAPGGDKGLGGGSSGSSSSGSSGNSGGGNESDNDRGGYGMSPGRSQAQFGTTEFAGMSEQDAKDSLAGGGGSDQAQAVQAALAAQAAAANAQRDIAANAAQTRPQVSLTTVENPQETQDLLDVFSSSTTPTTVDPTAANAIQATYSPTSRDTLSAISDMLGLENDLLADPTDMTDRQALARSAPAVDVTSSTTGVSDVLGMDDEYDDGIPDYSDPNRPGYKDGLPKGLEYADTRRGKFTTNLAGLTAKQRAEMPGYMSPKGKEGIVAGLMNMVGLDPSSTAYGYEFDDTGRVTGMIGPAMPSIGPASAAIDFLTSSLLSPPQTTEDLLNRGVYTGYGPASVPQGGDGGGDDPIIYPPPAPEVAPEYTASGFGGMDSPYVAPPSLPSPLVPSDRAYTPTNLPMPVGYGDPQTGYINPLAYLTSGFPVGTQFFADGGEVLDQAAGRFLEALTAA